MMTRHQCDVSAATKALPASLPFSLKAKKKAPFVSMCVCVFACVITMKNIIHLKCTFWESCQIIGISAEGEALHLLDDMLAWDVNRD